MRVLHVTDDLADTSGVVVFIKGLTKAVKPYGIDGSIMIAEDRTIPDEDCDIVHLHGMWLPVYHRMSKWARRKHIPIVWSPHGMLTPWAMHNHWWKKLPYWHLVQKRDMRYADVLHVTAESEAEDLRRLGLENRIAIAPLGVDLNPLNEKDKSSASGARQRTILFISRIQKKKGLPMLLEAWSRLQKTHGVAEGWRIVIAGPNEEGHLQELMHLAKRLSLSNVEFRGAVLGQEKERLYCESDIFILPTHSENFGSVVIEALACGTPVICTKGAPWQELETFDCGRWVDISVDAITQALAEMMSLSDEVRAEMGERGRRLVEEKYTWSAVGKTMKSVYEGLLS